MKTMFISIHLGIFFSVLVAQTTGPPKSNPEPPGENYGMICFHKTAFDVVVSK